MSKTIQYVPVGIGRTTFHLAPRFYLNYLNLCLFVAFGDPYRNSIIILVTGMMFCFDIQHVSTEYK